MSRTTIDYGIDLGTTNSAIAVIAGTGTEVIKNNVDADITPSAVYINRSGNLWVGQNAKSKLADERAILLKTVSVISTMIRSFLTTIR